MNTPHAISYRWRNEPDEPLEPLHEENSTVFTFTLTPRPDGTELTVVESGFQYTPDPQERLEGHRDGWDEKLDQLLALRELSS